MIFSENRFPLFGIMLYLAAAADMLVAAAVSTEHDPEKLVLDLIGDGNRFPAGACARAGQRPDPSAKPASAGEGRSEKIMLKKNVRLSL